MAVSKKTTLRELLSQGQVFAPCIFDCISARAVELSGFKATLLSGGALAYSLCGVPDMGLLSADEVIWATSRISDYSPLPLIVDGDDGYGEGPIQTYRFVHRIAKAGAMAISIDDSTGIRGWERQFQKDRPPHRVVEQDIWLSKIKAALKASAGTDCMIIARTEAMFSRGFDEAVERVVKARELGAEMTLVMGLKTLEQGIKVAEKDPGWKMWPDVSVTDGHSDVELADIDKLGFNLVTMHYTEKGAMFGMIDYGMHTIKDRNTVYIDEHDFDGLLPGKDHHTLFSFHKKWLPMEDEFNDLAGIADKPDSVEY